MSRDLPLAGFCPWGRISAINHFHLSSFATYNSSAILSTPNLRSCRAILHFSDNFSLLHSIVVMGSALLWKNGGSSYKFPWYKLGFVALFFLPQICMDSFFLTVTLNNIIHHHKNKGVFRSEDAFVFMTRFILYFSKPLYRSETGGHSFNSCVFYLNSHTLYIGPYILQNAKSRGSEKIL